MRRKLLVAAVAILILAPAIVFTAVATLVAAIALTGVFPNVAFPGALLLALMVVAGWFGISASIKLCVHFFRSERRPPGYRLLAVGLLSGSLVCLYLVGISDRSMGLGVAFFGWLLLGAAILAATLCSSSDAT